MRSTIVMTVIGPDRAGIVEDVSGVVSEHGGNWLDSRMVHWAGEFAGVLRVEIDRSLESELRAALALLSDKGLQVLVRGDEQPGDSGQGEREEVSFRLVGQDRPGIIANVSRIISQFGANVEELHSSCESAPMTGETLFQAQAKLSVPKGRSVENLREALEAIASDLMVDLSLDSE